MKRKLLPHSLTGIYRRLYDSDIDNSHQASADDACHVRDIPQSIVLGSHTWRASSSVCVALCTVLDVRVPLFV